MKRWIGLSLLLVPLLASAAGFWDGNAAMQRGDSTFESGSFAASNSFPPGTRILVTNLETGKSAEATVTERIGSQSDILVLLSPKAASALGLSQGMMASIRVTVLSRPEEASVARPGEQAFSMDPDVNPGAEYDVPSQISEPAQPASPQPAETPAAEAPQATTAEVPEGPAAVTATTTVAEAPAQPAAQASADQQQAEDAAVIAEAAARTPQKRLFLPPREDEKFAYKPSAETQEQPAAAETIPETQPTAAEITAVIGEPTTGPGPRQPTDIKLAEALAPQESRPEEIVGAAYASPAPEKKGVVALSMPEPKTEEQKNAPLEPARTEVSGPVPAPTASAEPATAAAPNAPPQKQPVQQAKLLEGASPAAATPAASAQGPKAQAAASLPRTGKANTYFLQLAAYSTEKGAQDVAARLTPTYPTLVIAPPASGTRVFRVVIGPLNRAESGTLLTWFRYRGFPDAFLKQE
jgi:rare lipoprotein A (peptidoglycan hydrolase)